jgi:Domain of unknown function (DU1801)
MAEAKTQPTAASVTAFIDTVADETRRADCKTVLKMMRKATGAKPVMWGSAIVGFGSYRMTYANGRTGDWPIIGFSPRKSALTLYLMTGYDGQQDLLARLGRHKSSKACLYLNKLADVDIDVLAQMIERTVAAMAPRRVS